MTEPTRLSDLDWEVAPLGPMIQAHDQAYRRLIDAKYNVPGAATVTAEDHLHALVLGECIARKARQFRGVEMVDALRAGATWSQLAAAVDAPEEDLRTLAKDWADSQRSLYTRWQDSEEQPIGLSADEYTEVIALLNRRTTEGEA